jgi:hypothetical protein
MKPKLEMMLARLRLPAALTVCACDVCHQFRPNVSHLGVVPWREVCAECIDGVLEALGL